MTNTSEFTVAIKDIWIESYGNAGMNELLPLNVSPKLAQMFPKREMRKVTMMAIIAPFVKLQRCPIDSLDALKVVVCSHLSREACDASVPELRQYYLETHNSIISNWDNEAWEQFWCILRICVFNEAV